VCCAPRLTACEELEVCVVHRGSVQSVPGCVSGFKAAGIRG